MAVIDVPLTQLQECTFTLQDGTTSSAFAKGKAFNITQVVDPTWKLKVRTIDLTREKRQIWSAWKSSLRGGLNRIRAWDVSQAAPLAYRSAKQPSDILAGWPGTGGVVSLGSSGALQLSNLPPGYVASVGDRVSLEQNDRIGLYEIQSTMIASGAGVVQLTVSPFLHTTYFNVGAVARLWRPCALFVMDWKTWDLSVTSEMTPASFEAYQVLK